MVFCEKEGSDSLTLSKKQWFVRGMRDGIPIALGYFAVSMALGIAAKKVGFTAFQATLTSFLINASAGEYVGFMLIGAGAGYLEVFLMEAVANARYLLMSCALSQKLGNGVSTLHRLLLGYDNTDEIFGISIAAEGKLCPFYTYGAVVMALPGWSLGTLCGHLLGNVLPARLLSALGVSLYGMFISVFIPEAKKNKVVCGLIVLSFALSYLFHRWSALDGISSGVKILILTVAISLAAAILFPVKEVPDHEG